MVLIVTTDNFRYRTLSFDSDATLLNDEMTWKNDDIMITTQRYEIFSKEKKNHLKVSKVT